MITKIFLQRDTLIHHQALLFISSVGSILSLDKDRQTWLMRNCDTAELLLLYRKVSLATMCAALFKPKERYMKLVNVYSMSQKKVIEGQ